jgi:hypothetical protein
MTRFLAFVLLLNGTAAVAVADTKPLLSPDRPIEEVVDHYISAALQAANVKPAPPADDATVLRRTTLDLAGRIPTCGELDEYLTTADASRRLRLVERLLASPDYVRHQTQELLAFMQAEEEGRRGPAKTPLSDYLAAGVAENRPWDQVFRDVLLPDDGNAKKRGAADFLRRRVRDLNRLTIDVSTIFFGVNISCAQCHDHPHVQDWKQDHFYGMKSFFARTFEAKGTVGERDIGLVKFTPNKGKEKVASVMFLSGKVIDMPGLADKPKQPQKERKTVKKEGRGPAPPKQPRFSLRAKLVEVALEPGQREYFSRAIVNRVWHRLMGRGLVMPLDQMHSANPPSHPELLQWLARDFETHGYDLRRLIRGLVLSQVYARSSRWNAEESPDPKLFAVAALRPLTPMQMAASLRLASTDPESLPKNRPALDKRLDSLIRGADRFAAFFPQPSDHFQVGVGEALLFANNDGLQADLLQGPGALPARLKQVPDLGRRADLAVRTVLGRPARADEVQALTDYMRRRADRTEDGCRQVVWALLTSAEFRFNH